MPNTTTDPVIEKQKWILARRTQAAARYLNLWTRLTADWNSSDPDDNRVWLMYSANYLFRTAGVRWAMDPLLLRTRVPEAPDVNAVDGFRNLSFLILTHRHADHLDLDLLHAVKEYPIQFIVPEFMLSQILEQTGIPEHKITVPIPLQPFDVNGIRITPFNGLHWESDATRPNGLRGVPALGYLVEFSGKRWLFPGDTRLYDAEQIPDFGPVDGLFAHLWLGRTSAMLEYPPLLDDFCRFCLDLQPRCVVLSHLHELNRDPLSYWDESHAALAAAILHKDSPDTRVSVALMGESVNL